VAPLDTASIEAWLARVLTLRVDGSRPTVEVLSERLASFWIPGETVVYIGQTHGALGKRCVLFTGRL
jgi:hypothetical protein